MVCVRGVYLATIFFRVFLPICLLILDLGIKTDQITRLRSDDMVLDNFIGAGVDISR